MSIQDLRLPTLWPLWVAGAYVVFYVARYYPGMGLAGADSHAYWLTGHDPLYTVMPGSHDAFVYSPAFAQVIHPLAQAPWLFFASCWVVIETLAFAWLWWPLGWRWAVPLTCVCSIEIGIGNIYGLLAVSLVLGMKHASAWAFPLLTKVMPAVGIIWFAVRREWRQLRWTIGTSVAVAAISFAAAPGDWHNWIRYLMDNRGADPTTPYHVAAGFVLAVVAARRNSAWLLAPAMLLACPIIHGWLPITFLAAIPRLLARDAATAVSETAPPSLISSL